MNARMSIVVIALILLPGCQAFQSFLAPDAPLARQEIGSLRGDFNEFAEEFKNSAIFNEEQRGILTGIQEKANARLDAIDENLAPADLSDISGGIGAVGRAIGGPAGTLLGVLGLVGQRVLERRGRTRIVRQIVQSVEDGRKEDGTFDIKAVQKAQKNMGIRRYVRDVTGDISGDHALE